MDFFTRSTAADLPVLSLVLRESLGMELASLYNRRTSTLRHCRADIRSWFCNMLIAEDLAVDSVAGSSCQYALKALAVGTAPSSVVLPVLIKPFLADR